MTLHTEFLPQPTVPVPTAAKVAVAGAVAALIGSFMAWVSITSIFGQIQVTGFDGGDGKLTAAAAVCAGLLGLAATKRSAAVVAMLAAVAGLAVALYDWSHLQHLVNGADSALVRPSVGNGLYLCVAGFVVCLVGLWNAMPDDDVHWQTDLR